MSDDDFYSNKWTVKKVFQFIHGVVGLAVLYMLVCLLHAACSMPEVAVQDMLQRPAITMVLQEHFGLEK